RDGSLAHPPAARGFTGAGQTFKPVRSAVDRPERDRTDGPELDEQRDDELCAGARKKLGGFGIRERPEVDRELGRSRRQLEKRGCLEDGAPGGAGNAAAVERDHCNRVTEELDRSKPARDVGAASGIRNRMRTGFTSVDALGYSTGRRNPAAGTCRVAGDD